MSPALARLEFLTDLVAEECEHDEPVCHGHDRTDDGGCALVTDLRSIRAELERERARG